MSDCARSRHRAFAVLASVLFALCAVCVIAEASEDTEAAGSGTASDPYTGSVTFGLSGNTPPETMYVEVGTSITITGFSIEAAGNVVYMWVSSVTSGYGLTASGSSVSNGATTLSGTISRAGTISYVIDYLDINGSNTWTYTIIAVESVTYVSSITISGSESGAVGSSITLTATSDPSDADDRHVTWSITSGSAYASISNTSDTTSGGRATISLEAAGTVTVRATATDGSGVTASHTITITEPVYDFVLSFNANGGSGAPSSMNGTSSQSTYTFTIPATVPSRSGYTFQGWSTSSSATTAAYSPGDSITIDEGTTTLYAVWSAIEYTSTLYYSAEGASNVPSTQTYTGTSTSDHVFTISSQVPVRSGYEFLGWSLSSGDITAAYQPGTTISVPYNGSVTLYGVWAKVFTLTFSVGVGTWDQGDLTYSSATATSHVFTIPLAEPERAGYRFLGWATVSGGAVAYDPGDDVSVTSSTTLYAVWARETTITLTFNANGGSEAPDAISATVISGESYTFTIPFEEPYRDGYTFLGWSTSRTGSAMYSGGDTYEISANGTLYAVWEAWGTMTLSFSANGGSGAPSALTATVGADGTCTFTIPVAEPTRSGYTFQGWSASASASTVQYVAGDEITISVSTTLYAVWAADPSTGPGGGDGGSDQGGSGTSGGDSSTGGTGGTGGSGGDAGTGGSDGSGGEDSEDRGVWLIAAMALLVLAIVIVILGTKGPWPVWVLAVLCGAGALICGFVYGGLL